MELVELKIEDVKIELKTLKTKKESKHSMEEFPL